MTGGETGLILYYKVRVKVIVCHQLFINVLEVGIKQLGIGVKAGNESIPILMNADDVAILIDNEQDNDANLLDYVDLRCKIWMMKVKMSKTKVIHFQKTRTCT